MGKTARRAHAITCLPARLLFALGLAACLAACGVILVAVFALDAAVSGNQAIRLHALLEGNRTSGSASDTEWASVAKDLGDVLSPAEVARENRLFTRQGRMSNDHRSAAITQFLKENHDGSKIPKDLD